MTTTTFDGSPRTNQETWLKRYYFVRAAFSLAWVAAAFTLGRNAPIGALLLVLYPLWDAAANYVDAARSGGLGRNRPQAINFAVSLVAALSAAIALQSGSAAVLTVFGAWAALSGILQLVAAIRRWRTAGAQWAMTLSGAQSTLAGIAFVLMAQQLPAALPTIAGYAAFGAVYFLVSGLWLAFAPRFRRQG